MGKASAPAAPDYTPIAAADAQAAQIAGQTSKEQLQWAKDQFNTIWPYAQQYLDQQTRSSAAQTAAASDAQNFFDSTYKPIEQQFAQTAQTYNSPVRADQNAGAAMADVSNAYEGTRRAALQNLESYGIDPSQTRYGALDLSTRVGQAAASAAAGTQSRLNTEATGLALKGEAINIGRGYPGSIANSYATATNSGMAGINAANNTTATGAGTMGTGTQWAGVQQGALGGETSALNTSFQNNLAGANFNANQSNALWSGVGGLVGAGLSAYAFNPAAFKGI